MAVKVRDQLDAELAKLSHDMGIDLPGQPPVMLPEQVAAMLHTTTGALANDRYRGVGIPYVKHGKRVRYLRADVARYLIAQRRDNIA